MTDENQTQNDELEQLKSQVESFKLILWALIEASGGEIVINGDIYKNAPNELAVTRYDDEVNNCVVFRSRGNA